MSHNVVKIPPLQIATEYGKKITAARKANNQLMNNEKTSLNDWLKGYNARNIEIQIKDQIIKLAEPIIEKYKTEDPVAHEASRQIILLKAQNP